MLLTCTLKIKHFPPSSVGSDSVRSKGQLREAEDQARMAGMKAP